MGKFRYILVIICPKVGFVRVIPIRYKSEVIDKVKETVLLYRQTYGVDLRDKVVFTIRADNEPVLNSKEYNSLLGDLQLAEQHPTPYQPQMNGVVERFMDSLQTGIKTMLVGVDKRVWCFAAQYFGAIWNRVGRKKNGGQSPHQMITDYVTSRRELHQTGVIGSSQSSGDLDPQTVGSSVATTVGLSDQISEDVVESADDISESDSDADGENEDIFVQEDGLPPFKRFGCLCYTLKQPRNKNTGKFKLEWKKAMFLGMDPQSSNFLVGSYVGENFSEVRTNQVKFVEDVLVDNIENLKATSRRYEEIIEKGLDDDKPSSEEGTIYLYLEYCSV